MIKVTDDYIIQVDDFNYTVCQNKPYTSIDRKTGKERISYPSIGYCGSLESALSLIRNRIIRDRLKDGERSLTEAVEEVRKVTAEFKSVMEKAMSANE